MAKTGLLEAIASITSDDLEAIDAEIATLEKRLAALQAARRLADTAINGPRQRAERQPRVLSTQATSRQDADPQGVSSRIYDLIATEGPLPISVIAQRLRSTPAGIGISIARSGWFLKTPEGDVAIKKAGA